MIRRGHQLCTTLTSISSIIHGFKKSYDKTKRIGICLVIHLEVPQNRLNRLFKCVELRWANMSVHRCLKQSQQSDGFGGLLACH
jgi:hypothetical protein